MIDLRAMHAAVEEYLEHGWPIIPIPPVNGRPAKGPQGTEAKGWPDRLLEPGCAMSVLRENWNIGLLLREFYDVDLDCQQAHAAARIFLPYSGLIYGHASSPSSHRLYRTTTPLSHKEFEWEDSKRGNLLELRVSKPGGAHQSVLPPSIHPGGEHYEWNRYEEAAQVDGSTLWRAVHLVAITAALAKCHPSMDNAHKAARDEFRLAISGVLARRLREEDAVKVFKEALRIAGDSKDRSSIFQATLEKLRGRNGNVKGFPALIAIIGQKAANSVIAWIDAIAEKESARTCTQPCVEVREPGEESEIVSAEPASLPITDMPEDVLCGRLGEICQRRMKSFPRAYAFPALVVSAGILANQNSTLRSNLLLAACGPVGTGKTKATEHANATLGLDSPEVVNTMAGSVEGLLDKLKDANGTARLYFPDELSHLFEKAQIEHSAFCPVLNRAFYHTQFDLTVAGRKVIPFNCSLSVAGGLVLDDPDGGDNFEECFNSATTAGTYDRFLFGRCPRPFTYSYRPFEGGAERLNELTNVGVEPAVWDLRDEWIKTIQGMSGRVAEIALRVASICAGFDGVTLLRADSTYLKAALALAKYQIKFRSVMRPNPDKNDDAKCAAAIRRKLEELSPNGEWVDKRTISKAIHAERYGPGVFYRCGNYLVLNCEIESKREGTTKKAELWRRL